jgi:pimeloyl-ACP methyl ester carboxylesterase
MIAAHSHAAAPSASPAARRTAPAGPRSGGLASRRRRWAPAAAAAAAAPTATPAALASAAKPVRSIIPREHLDAIEEPAARQLLNRMVRVPLPIPGLFGDDDARPVDTAVVPPPPPPPSASSSSSSSLPPVVMLHGFDSSSLEFRRLHPRLAQEPHALEPWAVDLVGWGFTDAAPFAAAPTIPLPPSAKRAHLLSFWREQLGSRPMLLVGASLGGAVAIDFAIEHPEAVAGLALIDPQAFVDGLGPPLPRPLAEAGVWVLRTVPLRQAANQMAYYDKKRYATDDAMRCGRLHTHMQGWSAANCAWMAGGGYVLPEQRVKELNRPTLLIWGRQDGILPPENAAKFEAALGRGEGGGGPKGAGVLEGGATAWLDECGHCGHLEQPDEVARLLGMFARRLAAGGEAAAA